MVSEKLKFKTTNKNNHPNDKIPDNSTFLE